jgi:hypothetical protein
MTAKELRPFVDDYHRAFPDWQLLEGGELFGRESGPLLQYIGFERLSTGAYRPTCGIYYLCVPDRDGSLGPQWLNVKVRQVKAREHESFREKVLEAIHTEIVPNVDAQLDADQVLRMHEAYEFIRSPDAHSLAALNAYLGNDDRALFWCLEFPRLVEQLGLGWQDFDVKRREFLEQLEKWIRAGEAKQQLERILQKERRKWGLT